MMGNREDRTWRSAKALIGICAQTSLSDVYSGDIGIEDLIKTC